MLPNSGLSIYQSEGSPDGILVSLGKGQLCVDRSTPALYQANDANGTSWSIVAGGGGGGISSLEGDVVAAGSGAVTATVEGIQGIPVSATAPIDGQLLAYDSGSNTYVPVGPASGVVASLSGAGIESSPGLLVQAGGFTINDSESDGVNFTTIGGTSIVDNSAAGLYLTETALGGTADLDANGNGVVNIGATTSGSTILGSSAPTLPVTIVTGTNDEFTYNPESGGSVVYTIAGGDYSTFSTLADAMNTAVDSSSAVWGSIVAMQPNPASNGALWGDGDITLPATISAGTHDALASLGFTSPTSFIAETTDVLSFFFSTGSKQQAAIAEPTGGAVVDTQARTAIDSILSLLSAASGGYGLTA